MYHNPFVIPFASLLFHKSSLNGRKDQVGYLGSEQQSNKLSVVSSDFGSVLKSKFMCQALKFSSKLLPNPVRKS